VKDTAKAATADLLVAHFSEPLQAEVSEIFNTGFGGEE